MRTWIQRVRGNYYQVPDQYKKAIANKKTSKKSKATQSVLEHKGHLEDSAKQSFAHCLCKLNKRH